MSSAVERLCHLPRDLRKGESSLLRLVVDSGIRQELGKFTESAILHVLGRDPGLVDDWLAYSADKRTTSGWYFIAEERRYYIVGTLGGQRVVFDDPMIACVSFIVRELADIVCRTSGP